MDVLLIAMAVMLYFAWKMIREPEYDSETRVGLIIMLILTVTLSITFLLFAIATIFM